MFKYSIFYILCINTGECFIKPRIRMQTNLRKPRWKWAGEMYSNKKSIDDNKEEKDALVEARVNNAYWSLSDLYENAERNKIVVAAIANDGTFVDVMDIYNNRHTIDVLPTDITNIESVFLKNNIRFAVQKKQFQGISNVLGGIGSILIPSLLLFYVIAMVRGMNRFDGNGSPGGGLFNGGIGGGTHNVNLLPETGVTFDDVAGCDDSKMELQEVVEFLKNPEKFSQVGALCPKGVLLDGPPGTGKTLLAKAVAGEAKVPFISTSGSEFVEIYVGMGASRVRKLFADAKKNSPCIIFIDEIDSIGRSRGRGGPGSNDEREQTLNQILSEMDGFMGNTGIIVLAATNRVDILDQALLRPGRFDRKVPVNLPDKNGRYEILKVHSRDKPLDIDVDLNDIAANTIGFSGASLKNLLNEAAIIAARNGKNTIGSEQIDFAIDRITVGQPKPIGSNVRKEIVAYHEAGHALMAALTPSYDKVAKVTIIPRSNGAGGFTLFTPSEERIESGLYSQKYLKEQLMVALGGRVAEEIQFGEEEITSGASADLQQVRTLARKMVTQLGFTNQTNIDSFPVAWESNDPSETMYNSRLSPKTENFIDMEISSLVKEAYNKCKNILTTNKKLLDRISEELIVHETISGPKLMELLNKNLVAS